jgi:O-antigen ligase
VIAAFVIGATAAAALGVMAGAEPTPYGQAARISGEFENANTLASTLVASLSLSLGLAFALKEHTIRRNFALGAAAFAMLGILLTVSRSGLVALGVAAIAAIIFSGRWRAKVALVSVGVAVSAVIYFLAFAPPEARDRVSHLEGGTGRSDIWKVAWRMSEENPTKGVGAGNFRTSSIHYVVAPGILRRSDFLVNTQKVAHNVFLETLAELGIVGLSLLLLLIAMLVRTQIAAIWQFARNGDVQMEIIARASLIGLFGLLASLFFSSDQYNKQLWLLLALGPTLLAIARSQRSDDEADQN